MDISTRIKISEAFDGKDYEQTRSYYVNDPDFDDIFDDLNHGFVNKGESGDDFANLTPRELGREGERLAATYLTARGYTILERNWRCSEGEVDLICEDDEGTTVLVEVKSRYERGPNPQILPELAVDNAKQHKLARLALRYLMQNPNVHSMRFDVIAINVMGKSTARIRHLVGAFTWDE